MANVPYEFIGPHGQVWVFVSINQAPCTFHLLSVTSPQAAYFLKRLENPSYRRGMAIDLKAHLSKSKTQNQTGDTNG